MTGGGNFVWVGVFVYGPAWGRTSGDTMKIFLSHTSKDKPIVRHVGQYLERKGYTVWLDEWEMTPGDSLVKKISEGVESSDKLVVFLSPESIKSPWVERELNGGLIMEVAEEKGLGSKFVIPVLLEACKVPFFLRDKLYSNFTNKGFDDACEELMSGLENKSKERLMEPYSNAVVTAYTLGQRGDGLFVTILEFTSNLSPITGASIQVETDGYREVFERIGASGDLKVPDICSLALMSPSCSSDGKIFRRSFTGPDLKKGISYFLTLAADAPVNLISIAFADGYGNAI